MSSQSRDSAGGGLAPVRVGTSGYSFADWIGVFYPHYTPKGKMLDYYVRHFPTVEINSTYYRIPHPAVMYNVVKKAPDGFDFMVKVPQSFTHTRAEMESQVELYRESIRPIAEAGKLAGCLAQFPYAFRPTEVSFSHVTAVREAVAPHALFVEFRHGSWSTSGTYERLSRQGIGYVSVDEPDLPGLLDRDLHVTTDTAYVRLHGRNGEGWWGGGDQRYNYLYSDQELEEWRSRIEEVRNQVRQVYLYFNNCYDGKAARNALEFMNRLGIGG